MLLILTSVLGYELKTAVGTSVFIMSFTAFTGARIAFCHRKFAGYYCNGALYMLYFNLGTDRSPLCK